MSHLSPLASLLPLLPLLSLLPSDTLAGPILIAMNPYTMITHDGVGIYGEQWMKRYRDDGGRTNFDVAPTRGKNKLGPHVFYMADLAFRRLLESDLSQCTLLYKRCGG